MTEQQRLEAKKAQELKEYSWQVQTELFLIVTAMGKLVFPRHDSAITDEVNEILMSARDQIQGIKLREAKDAIAKGVSFSEWEYPPHGQLPRRIYGI